MCQPNVSPGVTESDHTPNKCLHAIVASTQFISSSVSTCTEDTRTELDSHAVFLVKTILFLNGHGRNVLLLPSQIH